MTQESPPACSRMEHEGEEPKAHQLIIGEEGIRPDPKKVTAVIEMKSPACKDKLERFLGMTTYLSKFIENYSKMSAPTSKSRLCL